MFYSTCCRAKSKSLFISLKEPFSVSYLEEMNFKTSPDCLEASTSRTQTRPHLVLPFHNAVPEAVEGLGRRPVQFSQRHRELVVRGLQEVQLERVLAAEKYCAELTPLERSAWSWAVCAQAKLTSSSCCSVSSRFFWVENDGFPE